MKDWWEILTKETKIKQEKKVRKNVSKRITLPKSIKLAVYNRSRLICEADCKEEAAAIHHKVSVEAAPYRQWELDNLENLCLAHHQSRHPDLPAILFNYKINAN